LDKHYFYLFTHSKDIEESLTSGGFFLGRTVPNSIKLELVNYDGDQVMFCIVFDKGYRTTRLTQEQYEKACQLINDCDALVQMFCGDGRKADAVEQ
jgi:hypothetical protein